MTVRAQVLGGQFLFLAVLHEEVLDLGLLGGEPTELAAGDVAQALALRWELALHVQAAQLQRPGGDDRLDAGDSRRLRRLENVGISRPWELELLARRDQVVLSWQGIDQPEVADMVEVEQIQVPAPTRPTAHHELLADAILAAVEAIHADVEIERRGLLRDQGEQLGRADRGAHNPIAPCRIDDRRRLIARRKRPRGRHEVSGQGGAWGQGAGRRGAGRGCRRGVLRRGVLWRGRRASLAVPVDQLLHHRVVEFLIARPDHVGRPGEIGVVTHAVACPPAGSHHNVVAIHADHERVGVIEDLHAHVILRHGVVGRPQAELAHTLAPGPGRGVFHAIGVDRIVPDLLPGLQIHHNRHPLLLDELPQRLPDHVGA